MYGDLFTYLNFELYTSLLVYYLITTASLHFLSMVLSATNIMKTNRQPTAKSNTISSTSSSCKGHMTCASFYIFHWGGGVFCSGAVVAQWGKHPHDVCLVRG